MLIIESMLHFFGSICVWSALPNVCLLMKLVSTALPYVLMSSYHRFGMLEHIMYLRLLTIYFRAPSCIVDPYINLRLEKVSI
jgi:hypothetical protein